MRSRTNGSGRRSGKDRDERRSRRQRFERHSRRQTADRRSGRRGAGRRSAQAARAGRSPLSRIVGAVLVGISLGVVMAAERDISRRSDAEVHGSRTMWRILSLNALGAGTYFGWGRRHG